MRLLQLVIIVIRLEPIGVVGIKVEQQPPRHFIGFCNGAQTKKQCAFFNRKRGHLITIPVQENGVIFTGRQPDNLNITVIDLDVEPGKSIPDEMLDLPSKCTFTVRSGKGGLHLYFYTETEIPSTQRTPSRIPGITNVDRRGKSGILFAPGCKFEDHDFKPYTIINDVSILHVSDKKLWEIWDHYAASREGEGIAVEKTLRDKKNMEKNTFKDTRDFPSKKRILPEIIGTFQDINYPACINNILLCCEQGIHLCHEERWLLASFMVAAGKPESAIVDLFRRMPDFNRAISAYQVHHVATHRYKPRNCITLVAMHICPRSCGKKNPIAFINKR